MNKTIKDYLPSKRFIISISILVGIIIVFLVLRLIAQKTVAQKDPATIVVENLSNPVLIDTDNDGVYDWEEALWGTDPQNPDSDADGIPDGVAIERQKNEIGVATDTEPSETEAFAKDLYTTIAVAVQGGLTEEKSAEIQNDIAKAIVNKKSSEPAYTEASIQSVPVNPTTFAAYASAIDIFFKNNDRIKQELEITTNQIKSGTIDGAYFKSVSNHFIELGKQLSQMQVPQNVLTVHTKFANDFNNLGIILGGLAAIETDPLIAFSHGIEHQDALINLSVSYANIGNYFTIAPR